MYIYIYVFLTLCVYALSRSGLRRQNRPKLNKINQTKSTSIQHP